MKKSQPWNLKKLCNSEKKHEKKKQERVPYQLVTATEGSSSDLLFSWNGKKVLRKQQAIEIR